MTDDDFLTDLEQYVEQGYGNPGLYSNTIALEAQVRTALAQEKIAESLDRVAAVMEQS